MDTPQVVPPDPYGVVALALDVFVELTGTGAVEAAARRVALDCAADQLADLARAAARRDLPYGLTGAQQDVWLELAAGRSTPCLIGDVLGLDEGHVRRVLDELLARHLIREVSGDRYALPSQELVRRAS